ncbi:ABC transporter substrate-binding protein [Pleionea sediminis]|uniref:ABC transporter substrate-binding protein n=1 Tax=Pleionea sediminis TaxID=2569479 RepID=UPI001185F701|nr:ABC transporter substrate binding protein [Pleionea sediminis]
MVKIIGRLLSCLAVIVLSSVASRASDSDHAQPSADNPSNSSVLIVEYGNSVISQTFATRLTKSIALPSQRYQVTRTTLDNSQLTLKAPLAIAVGKEALVFLLNSNYRGSVLATLLSASEYQKITKENPNPDIRLSGVFHQAPLSRQILLFKEFYPSGKRIGILLTPNEEHLIKDIKDFTIKLNLILEYEIVRDEAELTLNLIKLIKRSDAIIATKNESIYNRSTIKTILLTLYRHNKFLIGADKSFVRAGSVATTYTSMQNLLDEVTGDIARFFENKQLPNTHYSDQFSVEFNEQVARSLNLNIRDNSHYVDVIQASEINLGDGKFYE